MSFNKLEKEVFALPEHFWKIRDEAVEHVISNAPLPKDLNKLQNWLANEGWDLLSSFWLNEDIVLDLKDLATVKFNDSSIIASSEFELNKSEITDNIRVIYAMSMINESIEECDGYQNPSVHSFPIERKDRASAILGCTVEIHGQLGPVIVWHGVFKDVEDYYSSLRKDGFLFHREVDEIYDAQILAYWD